MSNRKIICKICQGNHTFIRCPKRKKNNNNNNNNNNFYKKKISSNKNYNNNNNKRNNTKNNYKVVMTNLPFDIKYFHFDKHLKAGYNISRYNLRSYDKKGTIAFVEFFNINDTIYFLNAFNNCNCTLNGCNTIMHIELSNETLQFIKDKYVKNSRKFLNDRLEYDTYLFLNN